MIEKFLIYIVVITGWYLWLSILGKLSVGIDVKLMKIPRFVPKFVEIHSLGGNIRNFWKDRELKVTMNRLKEELGEEKLPPSLVKVLGAKKFWS